MERKKQGLCPILDHDNMKTEQNKKSVIFSEKQRFWYFYTSYYFWLTQTDTDARHLEIKLQLQLQVKFFYSTLTIYNTASYFAFIRDFHVVNINTFTYNFFCPQIDHFFKASFTVTNHIFFIFLTLPLSPILLSKLFKNTYREFPNK